MNPITGNVSIDAQNIMPIIKKWLYSDKDIFIREVVSNACDAITKLRMADFSAASGCSVRVEVDKAAKELVREKGLSREFGAREVDRVIRNEIKPLFVDEILFGKLKNGGRIKLTVRDGSFAAAAAEQSCCRKCSATKGYPAFCASP